MKRIGFILKGYPRLSETFIAQEIRGLEERGYDIAIFSLRPPRESVRHPVVDDIRAPIVYLPEGFADFSWRATGSFWRGARTGPFWLWLTRCFMRAVRDGREPLLRFGQAVVLADAAKDCARLHAHFLHSPALVCEIASDLRGTGWTCSAHAKDIWTQSDDAVARKLAAMDGIVTCTAAGAERLRSLSAESDKVRLVYHGLDLTRFASPAKRDATDTQTLRLLSVGRAVAKKGFDTLLESLAALPAGLDWRWQLIGDGDQLDALKDEAKRLCISDRCVFSGAQSQQVVLTAYRESDVFVLPSRVTGDGDRDGLPNVIMEAMSQRLPVVSTRLPGISEAVVDGETGLLVPPDDPVALCAAITNLADNKENRRAMGKAGEARVRSVFSHEAGLDALERFFAHHQMAPDQDAIHPVALAGDEP